MGNGRIPTSQAPGKKRFYGNSQFNLRPIYLSQNAYFFALRPCYDNDQYDVEIEGEFSQSPLAVIKRELNENPPDIIGYLYYEEDLNDPELDPSIRKKILSWADCNLREFILQVRENTITKSSTIVKKEFLHHQEDHHGILEAYNEVLAKIHYEWTPLQGSDHQNAFHLFEKGLLEEKRTPIWKEGTYRGQSVVFRKLTHIHYDHG